MSPDFNLTMSPLTNSLALIYKTYLFLITVQRGGSILVNFAMISLVDFSYKYPIKESKNTINSKTPPRIALRGSSGFSP